MSIQNNTTKLQEILETINNLPEAGGVDLPTLVNEGSASELFLGKELIDDEGNIIEGTFTIDNELNTQEILLTQLRNALQDKASASELTLQAKIVNPTTSTQTIRPDSGYDCVSQVTVNGDSNLVAENIKSGVSIFGITGTHSGGGNTTNNAGEWSCVANLPTTYATPSGPSGGYSRTYYLPLEPDVNYVLFAEYPASNIPLNSFIVYWNKQSLTSDAQVFTNTSSKYTINVVSIDNESKILELVSIDNDIVNSFYYLPIYNKQ